MTFLSSRTSLVRYHLNLTLGCHMFYYLAPLPVLDRIFLFNEWASWSMVFLGHLGFLNQYIWRHDKADIFVIMTPEGKIQMVSDEACPSRIRFKSYPRVSQILQSCIFHGVWLFFSSFSTDGYHSTRTHFPDSEPTNLCSLSLVHVLIGDAIHINFIV
jgi:hypothetical protein